MPFFSREALEICWPTFGENYSALGLDSIWPRLLGDGPLAVVDAVVARHTRPILSGQRVMPSGLTPQQEGDAVLQKYKMTRLANGEDVDLRYMAQLEKLRQIENGALPTGWYVSAPIKAMAAKLRRRLSARNGEVG